MGTFHQGKGELHGITVVVDTTGAEIFVGRCDDMDERGIVLDDVDVHRDGDARFGVFKKYDRLFIPKERVASVRRLGELEV
jgi:hypothetical protein